MVTLYTILRLFHLENKIQNNAKKNYKLQNKTRATFNFKKNDIHINKYIDKYKI